MSSDHSDYLLGNSSITDFDFIFCIFLCLKIFSFKNMFTFCIRNNNICYGLNETNKTYNITHVEGFANQLVLKFISHPSPALFSHDSGLLANWLLVSFGQ